MKPVKPEDKPKVMALGAATLVMFGYVGISFAKSKSKSAAPAPTPSPAAPVSTSPPTIGTAPGGAPPPGTSGAQPTVVNGKPSAAQEFEAGAERQKIVLPNLSADPFQPAVNHKALEGAGTSITEVKAPAALAVQGGALPKPNPFVPPVPGSAGGAVPALPTAGGTMPGIAANPTAPMLTGGMNVVPIELTLKLNGVITGTAGNVALIQVGESEQFISVGDVVMRWRVLRIGIDTVTLRRANQVRVLRIGAGNNTSDALPMPTVPQMTKMPQAAPTPIAVVAHPPAAVAKPTASGQTAPVPLEVLPSAPAPGSGTAPVPQAVPTPATAPATPAPSSTPPPTSLPVPPPVGTPIPVVG